MQIPKHNTEPDETTAPERPRATDSRRPTHSQPAASSGPVANPPKTHSYNSALDDSEHDYSAKDHSAPEAESEAAIRSTSRAGNKTSGQQSLLSWRIIEFPAQSHSLPSQSETRKQTQEAFRLASNSGPFEWADIAWDLSDAGQPHTAAAFWTAVLELYDCDARVYLYLADCLSEAGAAERSLEAAERGYRMEPGLYEFQEAVLDRLFDLGRNETAFDWESTPIVTRLGRQTRDRIFEFINTEGECDLFDLRYELFDQEYVLFDVEGLAKDLERDERFEVCRFEGAAYVSHRLSPGP